MLPRRPSSGPRWTEASEDLVYELDRVDDPSEALLLRTPASRATRSCASSCGSVALSVQPIGRDRARSAAAAVPADGRGHRSRGLGRKRREASRSSRPSSRRGEPRARCGSTSTIRSTRRSGGQPRAPATERVRECDGRDGPGARLRPPKRTSSSSRSPSPRAPDRPREAPIRDRGRFPDPAGRRQLLGARRLALVPAAVRSPGRHYTFRATVRVQEAVRPVRVRERRCGASAEGDENVLETRVDKPIRLPSILAGKYEVQEEVSDGVTIRVATYALENPRAVKQLTNVAAEIIAYYQGFLGPFPFRSSTSSRSTTTASARRRRASCSSRRRRSTRSSAR